ncbi:MAG: ABC transporter ATP-binding protein [Adlercreutzia sp.]|nr:ABC transporter ATP-binding protein [Adlercreutzia sp.]
MSEKTIAQANGLVHRDSPAKTANDAAALSEGALICEGCDRTCTWFNDAALRGEGISVGYEDRIIIEPMDVALPEGKVTSIIGPNGCGKSTLLKALSRTMPTRSGAVYLNGTAIASLPTAEIARQMALLPQSPSAPGGLTVKELVSYGRYPHQKGFGRLTDKDREIIAWALEITHLTAFADRAIDALSGGQRQRAWIAMALAQDTDLILLDEPTTYLDMAHQLEVLELLQSLNRDQGKTIALVIHELNLAARFSDWMIAMKDGSIRAAGTADQVMTPPMMKEVFGLEALIEPDPWTGKPSLVSYRLA